VPRRCIASLRAIKPSLSQAWVGVDYKELPWKRDVPSSPFGRMGSHRAVGERALKDRPLFSVSHHHHS
jgi:hypothetical protein